MEGMQKFKENETQKKNLCEILQIATTNGYTAKRKGGATRMQGKIKMESFISILCHCHSILYRHAFENVYMR